MILAITSAAAASPVPSAHPLARFIFRWPHCHGALPVANMETRGWQSKKEAKRKKKITICLSPLRPGGPYQRHRALLLRRGKHGVGRIDIVENRFVGMKSRGEWSPTPKCQPSHKSSQKKKGENAGGISRMLSIAGVLGCRPHWQPSSAPFPSGFGGYEDFLLFFYEGSCPLTASAMVCASPGVPVPPETPRLGVEPGPGGKPPRLGLGG